MGENILQLLYNRSEFISHLEQDIYKNNQIIEQAEKEKDKLEELIENVKTLGKYPEQTSLIPLAKNIYMKGRIVHTGEHYLKITASPESYVVLNSVNQTLNYLEKNIELKKTDIENARYANNQLEERMKILKGNDSEVSPEIEKDDLPMEIKSEKGVAVRVGDLYEIFELEDKSSDNQP